MLVLSESVLSAVHAHCEAEHPREAKGLLLGRLTDDGARTVIFVVTASHEVTRPAARSGFGMGETDLSVADDAARAAGLDVIGVYRAHAEKIRPPSSEDDAAAQPGWSYLVVAISEGRALETRSFRFDASRGRLVEEDLDAR